MIKSLFKTLPNISRSLTLFSNASTASAAETPQKPKLSEGPSLVRMTEIESSHPQVFRQIMEQSQTIEARLVCEHKWRLSQLQKRVSVQDRERMHKINSILQGLTKSQNQYLQFLLVSNTENLQ